MCTGALDSLQPLRGFSSHDRTYALPQACPPSSWFRIRTHKNVFSSADQFLSPGNIYTGAQSASALRRCRPSPDLRAHCGAACGPRPRPLAHATFTYGLCTCTVLYLLPSRDVELCALPQRRIFAVGAKRANLRHYGRAMGLSSPAFARRRVALALA